MKDREVKIKIKIQELFFRLIIVYIDDMDRFEKKEMKKIRLINYIPKPIRKIIGSFEDKIVILFKTKAPKQTVYERGAKLSKPRKQNIKSLLYQKRTKTNILIKLNLK